MIDRVARTVGRYEILDEIGSGGMATVYRARQTDLDRLVALKELGAFRRSDAVSTQRFLRESRLAGSLSHPNIITVHDYFEEDGIPYIAMEYLERGSLRTHIGRVSLTQAAGVLEDILAALEYAERHGIVHRDLKPENVMVTADGRVKLTDFGIATASAQTRSALTAEGTTVGTPYYMAPEQAMGRELGPWTDLYSVGVMAFELLVGHVPFHDTEEPVAVLMRQVNDPIPPARAVNPELDQGMSDWIDRLLAKDPAARPQSAAGTGDELDELLIELVGPRWRRSARLLEPSRRPPNAPAGPATQPPTQSPRPPLMPRGAIPHAPPMADTVMPEPTTQQLPEDLESVTSSDPRGRRTLGLSKAGVTVLVGVIALAAAMGMRLASSERSGDRPRTAPVSKLAGRDLTVRVPARWSRLKTVPPLGLPLAHVTAAAPGGRSRGPVVEFGLVRRPASGSALLPAAFLDSTGHSDDRPPRRRAVRLAAQNLQAWRYPHLRPVGTRGVVTVFTVPTSAGVAAIACSAPVAQASSFARQCDAVASTLRLRRGTAYPLGPSQSYADALSRVLRGLSQATEPIEADLQNSESLAGQGSAARTLAGSYRGAAQQLFHAAVRPQDQALNRRLAHSLRGVANAYGEVATTAARGDPDAYLTASAAIPDAKAHLNAALGALRAAGYRVGAEEMSSPGPVDGSSEGKLSFPGADGGSYPGADGGAPADQGPTLKLDPRGDTGDAESDDTGDSESDDAGDSEADDSESDDPSDENENEDEDEEDGGDSP